MTSKAKERWEKLAQEAKEEETTKTFEALDSVEKALEDVGVLEEEDKGFRLPYSSRPKLTNSRWK